MSHSRYSAGWSARYSPITHTEKMLIEHLDDAEHLRHDVAELTRDLLVDGEEELVLARRVDRRERGNARRRADRSPPPTR